MAARHFIETEALHQELVQIYGRHALGTVVHRAVFVGVGGGGTVGMFLDYGMRRIGCVCSFACQ